jgi:hypothetical protein
MYKMEVVTGPGFWGIPVFLAHVDKEASAMK